jgi:hypothetical protein
VTEDFLDEIETASARREMRSSGMPTASLREKQPKQNAQLEEPVTSNIHAILIKIIMSYVEQNISTRFAQNLSMNREKIFRSAAAQETLGEALKAIDKSLSQIKTDQHRHRESIKALVASFYATNFAELNRLDLATTVEEFYTKL